MATRAEWQDMIQSLKYINTADPATAGARSLVFQLFDSDWDGSNQATATVAIEEAAGISLVTEDGIPLATEDSETLRVG